MLPRDDAAKYMIEFGSIIGGRQVASGQWIEVRNPFTGEIVGRVSEESAETTRNVLSRTRAARVTLTRHERAVFLERMAEALREERDRISRMITDESGLCLKDTLHEVSRAADVFHFAAIRSLSDDSHVFPCDVTAAGAGRRIYTMQQPLHLVAAITPFNHPLNQVAHKVAPSIATNNTMVLKPSPQTPLSAFYIADLAIRCGLPPDALNVVCGSTSNVGYTIVKSEEVEFISFTGSSETGRHILRQAGYKRLLLELGGSSAMLVLEDAEIEKAVELAVAGVFSNSGQRCTAIRRLVVHDSLADAFARRLAERASTLRFGDPYDPKMDMGTVISEEAAQRIEARVEASRLQGAKVLVGHRRDGALYAPTVLTDVSNEHPVVAGETFGPVACVLRFSDLDDALRIANDTPYGLSGAVVSNHWPSIQRVISELETGTVNVNEIPGFRLEWSPFGGIKASGLGDKEGVIAAMHSMTYTKTYSLPWDQA